ncbi:ABC transporter ATP-binding protein [Micromonospora echinofusca]|uniref:ABC-2 type transport system ATP-binding protein n=1 Tax=Micromonospora echinofusca TaxID=47858 RepID=A0A1C5GE40_MICEH|nr:ABC transporter ATP-binding protein [Micromonospora echinofusca]SCG18018.1 ABC-2 type transport system ATP-binding protein [Micromonospora echinofusca]
MTRRGLELSPTDGSLMSMDDVVIEVDGLRRSYGEFEAVRGISLRIRRGELFALLGTNGAGKTTTIEVLEGLQPATSGRVRVLGLDPVRDRNSVRPRTGVMLQHGGFTGSLTVRETVEIWRSLTVRPQSTAEVLDLVDLGDRMNVAVEQLSGGEGRRLELALAVLGRPEVLFLDEPTTGMDPASRRRTWDVVRELQKGGTTVLLTTHYLEEAEVLADRVAIMRGGNIVATGAPEDVVRTLPARISFRLLGTDVLPDLPHATRLVDGDRVVYESRQLQADLTRLLEWANAGDIRLAALSARPATLEDVFLDIAADHDLTDQLAEPEAVR